MIISPNLLTIGAEYSRADLAELFDATDLATSREGWYERNTPEQRQNSFALFHKEHRGLF